jgi:large subunit ribosomal protein L23
MSHQDRLMRIILSPIITEKTTAIREAKNVVVFKVALDANKIEIRQAVELLFNVEVSSVQTTNMKGQAKIIRGLKKTTSTYKKAYVTLRGDKAPDFLENN